MDGGLERVHVRSQRASSVKTVRLRRRSAYEKKERGEKRIYSPTEKGAGKGRTHHGSDQGTSNVLRRCGGKWSPGTGNCSGRISTVDAERWGQATSGESRLGKNTVSGRHPP